MPSEMPDFQAKPPAHSPHFVNQAEEECARILDFHGLRWEYEPRSFVLEEDEEGASWRPSRPTSTSPSMTSTWRSR